MVVPHCLSLLCRCVLVCEVKWGWVLRLVCVHTVVFHRYNLFIPFTRYHKQTLGAVQRPRPQQAEDKPPASVLISSLSCSMQNTFIPNCLEYDNLGKSQQTGPLKHTTGMRPSFPLHHTHSSHILCQLHVTVMQGDCVHSQGSVGNVKNWERAWHWRCYLAFVWKYLNYYAGLDFRGGPRCPCILTEQIYIFLLQIM